MMLKGVFKKNYFSQFLLLLCVRMKGDIFRFVTYILVMQSTGQLLLTMIKCSIVDHNVIVIFMLCTIPGAQQARKKLRAKGIGQ